MNSSSIKYVEESESFPLVISEMHSNAQIVKSDSGTEAFLL